MKKKEETYVVEEIVDFLDLSNNNKKILSLNAKAKNLLHNALSLDEFGRIKSLKMTKEVWDCLEMTHVGITKVKNTKIRLLTKEYEAFEMKEGKEISTGDLNSKILESVTEEYNHKVCAIEEIKNISEIPTVEIMGSLMTEELVVMRNKARRKGKQKKTPALNISKGEHEVVKNEEEEEDEEMAMISRNFKKYLRFKKNCGEFTQKPSTPKELSEAYANMSDNLGVLIKGNKDLISKNKSLQNDLLKLENNMSALKIEAKSSNEIMLKKVSLKSQLNDLKHKNQGLQKNLDKFTKGTIFLDEILASQQMSLNRNGIGFDGNYKEYSKGASTSKSKIPIFVPSSSNLKYPKFRCTYRKKGNHSFLYCAIKKMCDWGTLIALWKRPNWVFKNPIGTTNAKGHKSIWGPSVKA
ncbi:hypothetical protein LIER_07510 [Lithospermum erythrorhizon]|uniref:Uncharacterized protein n=1 Tax=Lithospermum erythrorhizon TaxID=34254 RepID=A0AAV3P9H0_LITER